MLAKQHNNPQKILKISNLTKSIKKLKENSTIFEKEIKGLYLINDFISKLEAAELLSEIYEKPWDNSLKRRTQHYGYSYNYKASQLDLSKKVEPLPKFVQFILPRLKTENILKNYEPDQLIINEYTPGQGITPHIDKISDFEDTICSLSLGCDIIMEFKKGNLKNEIILKENSLVILTKDARFLWTHSIPGRKSDKINGSVKLRKTRVSLTFRKKKKI